jgi:two-component system response regulator HydG
VDCSSFSGADLELQLFGSAKPAAHSFRPKEGLLLLARGGTIFLDGLMALPLDLQGKLLRVLQEKTIQPLGSTRSLSIDVRVIAATDRDLDSAVQHGSFRRDLYLRLNVVSLHLPPLRERRQDVPLLVQHILGQISSGKSRSYSVSPDAMKILMAYDWPGNVRELENCLERAAAITSGSILGSADFISLLQRNNSRPDQSSPESRILPLAEVEKQAILGTLEQLNGDKLMAARLLGIGKTTLYRKLKEYGVWRPWMDSSSAGK